MKNHELNQLQASYIYYICIGEKDCENFSGEVYPNDSEGVLSFNSFEDFIIKMELYMDEYGPQSFQDKRSLTEVVSKSKFVLPKRCLHRGIEMDELNRKCYLLTIFSRRNTEWQGALFYQEHLQLEFSNIIDLSNYFANQE